MDHLERLHWICYNSASVIYVLFSLAMRNVVSYLPAAAAAKSLQWPTLCDPIDGSLLGSSVPGILQARTLEWVAISFSNAWKWKVKVTLYDPMDCSLPGSSIHGSFQARVLEWDAIAFSMTRVQTHTSCIRRWSLNHWTAREVPMIFKYMDMFSSNEVIGCELEELTHLRLICVSRVCGKVPGKSHETEL